MVKREGARTPPPVAVLRLLLATGFTKGAQTFQDSREAASELSSLLLFVGHSAPVANGQKSGDPSPNPLTWNTARTCCRSLIYVAAEATETASSAVGSHAANRLETNCFQQHL